MYLRVYTPKNLVSYIVVFFNLPILRHGALWTYNLQQLYRQRLWSTAGFTYRRSRWKKKVRLKMERNSFDCAKSCLRLRFEIWLLVPRAQVRHLWSKYSTSMLLLGLFSWDVGPIGSAIIPPGLLLDFSSKQNMLIQFPPKNMLIQFPSTECRLTVWIFKQLC